MLHAPVEQVQAVLRDVDPPGLHAGRDVVAGEVRDADEADLAVAHDVVEGAHGLLERRRTVGPVHEVHVDVVGPEVLQALVDRRRGRVRALLSRKFGRSVYPTPNW